MAYEVELKAHVVEPLLLKKRLEALLGISCALCEHKEDIYFSCKGEDALFRMRSEQSGPSFDHMEGSLVFTHKTKAMEGGVEINEEVEFTSSPLQKESALRFFLSLGYEVFITKSKKGYRYTYPVTSSLPPLTIELVEVIGLGWFLEIEFLLEERAAIARAKRALMDFLLQLDIKETAIEERYYMHMLTEKRPEA